MKSPEKKTEAGGPQTSLECQEAGTGSAQSAEPICDRCGRVCKSKSGLTLHKKKCQGVKAVEKENILCVYCSRPYKTERALSAHKVKAHTSE